MAGAFVAVADDATAAYWNPAGLPTGAFFSLLVDHAISESRVDQSSPQQPAADWAGTMVALSTNAVAFSYYRLHINQIDRVSTLQLRTIQPEKINRQQRFCARY